MKSKTCQKITFFTNVNHTNTDNQQTIQAKVDWNPLIKEQKHDNEPALFVYMLLTAVKSATTSWVLNFKSSHVIARCSKQKQKMLEQWQEFKLFTLHEFKSV